MAEDTVDAAAKVAGLRAIPCRTEKLPIHGAIPGVAIPEQETPDEFANYGADAAALQALMQSEPELAQKLHPGFRYTLAEVVWAVRHEMARTVEDVLARRLRVLFLDARAALAMAPAVADLMARELRRDEAWRQEQFQAFEMLARQYLRQSSEEFTERGLD